MFPTLFNPRSEVFVCSSGSRLKVVEQLEYDSFEMRNKPVFIKHHNLYDDIQSYRDSTDLAIILRNLDVYEVDSLMSSYSFDDVSEAIVDFTKLPKNYGDLMKQQRKAISLFNGLDDAIRKEYNYSPYAFVNDIGSKHFIELFKKKDVSVDKVKNDVIKEVSADE